MALLDQRDIDDARSRDIANLAESFGVEFTGRRGKWWPARCPFPDHDDGSPSFYACPSAGKFKCHGCGRHGDTIAFVMEMQSGLSFRGATDQLNGKVTTTFIPPPKRELVAVEDEPVDEWERVSDLSLAPPMPGPWRKCRGIPHVERHVFLDEGGTLTTMFVDRFKNADTGKKVVIPFSCWFNRESSEIRWLPRGLANDQSRPLYRLHLLRECPAAKVLLVEGEAKADIAQQRLAEAGIKPEQLLVMGWHGGAEVADKVDLSPLSGRAVRLWPDADQHAFKAPHPLAGKVMPPLEQPGMKAMLKLADRVADIASHVLLVMPPEGVPDGWDLGDKFPPGFDLRQHLTNKDNCIMADTLRQMVAAMRASPATPGLVADNTKNAPAPGNQAAQEMLDYMQGKGGAANDGGTVPSFKLKHGSEVRGKSGPINWLVRYVIEKDVLAILYGEPGCGKSFWSLELALCVAFGIDFHGFPVKQGAAVYVAGEGHNGIGRRIDAFERKHKVTLTHDVPFYVSDCSASLADKDSARDVAEVILQTCAAAGDVVPAIIVVDTLGRNLGPFDENQAEAINQFTANIEHYLQKRWNATILVVHHSGKDASKGARGSSALKANADTQYHMTKGDDKVMRVHADKMKDAPEPPDRAYRMESIPLEFEEEDGSPAFGAVLVSTEWTEAPRSGVLMSGKNQKVAMQELRALEDENSSRLEEGGFDSAAARVSLDEWKQRLEARHAINRFRFRDVKEGLLKKEAIVVDGPYVRTSGLFI